MDFESNHCTQNCHGVGIHLMSLHLAGTAHVFGHKFLGLLAVLVAVDLAKDLLLLLRMLQVEQSALVAEEVVVPV